MRLLVLVALDNLVALNSKSSATLTDRKEREEGTRDEKRERESLWYLWTWLLIAGWMIAYW